MLRKYRITFLSHTSFQITPRLLTYTPGTSDMKEFNHTYLVHVQKLTATAAKGTTNARYKAEKPRERQDHRMWLLKTIAMLQNMMISLPDICCEHGDMQPCLALINIASGPLTFSHHPCATFRHQLTRKQSFLFDRFNQRRAWTHETTRNHGQCRRHVMHVQRPKKQN